MQAFRHSKTGIINTKPNWAKYLAYLEEHTSFEEYLKRGMFTPVFLEINAYKIGKPEENGTAWTAYARSEDDVDYMIFEYAPAGELAKFTEESVDLIEEV